MLSLADIDILTLPRTRQAIESNLGNDPLKIALDGSLPDARLVATQVKYLDRARIKLPSYYHARCIFDPLAYEQSSSEAVASVKEAAGELCIDLTCGLGVDSFILSRKFRRVIAVETNPVLVRLARENFRRLGIDNVEVVEATAEDFISNYRGQEPGLIYVDPDRRSGSGRKLLRLEDCSPDILKLYPALNALSERIMVKLSPLFDPQEAIRIFGHRTELNVISADGQCREILVCSGRGVGQGTVCATVVTRNSSAEMQPQVVNFCASGPDKEVVGQDVRTTDRPEAYRWLVLPDVALVKAGIYRQYFNEKGIIAAAGSPVGFSSGDPGGICGTVLEIVCAEEYAPKVLRRSLKDRGIRSATVYKRNFPQEIPYILRSLGIREGAECFLAITMIAGRPWCFFVKPVK